MINTNGSTNASDIVAKAKDVGFTPTQTENGPLKLVDENGIARVTIKEGKSASTGKCHPTCRVEGFQWTASKSGGRSCYKKKS